MTCRPYRESGRRLLPMAMLLAVGMAFVPVEPAIAQDAPPPAWTITVTKVGDQCFYDLREPTGKRHGDQGFFKIQGGGLVQIAALGTDAHVSVSTPQDIQPFVNLPSSFSLADQQRSRLGMVRAKRTEGGNPTHMYSIRCCADGSCESLEAVPLPEQTGALFLPSDQMLNGHDIGAHGGPHLRDMPAVTTGHGTDEPADSGPEMEIDP